MSKKRPSHEEKIVQSVASRTVLIQHLERRVEKESAQPGSREYAEGLRRRIKALEARNQRPGDYLHFTQRHDSVSSRSDGHSRLWI